MPKIVKKYGKIALILGLVLVFAAMYVLIPSVRAGTVTSRSDTLSDSRPSTVSNHTIKFTIESAVDAGDTITITFASGFNMGSVDYTDIDLEDDDTDLTLAATPGTGAGSALGAAISGQVLTITENDTDSIAAASVVEIEIGTNATHGVTGDQQITNPTAAVYDIDVAGTFGDTGKIKVAIVSGVSVSATVAETLTFTISAVASGQTVNGATTNVATTSGDAVPLGALSTSSNKIAAHDLATATNASSGYTATTKYTQKLRIDASNDIDDHSGSNASPSSFSSAGTEAFGYTTDDSTLGTGTTDRFTTGGGDLWAAFTTSPLEVAYHDGPADGTTSGSGKIRVGYQAGITSTTTAGSYSTTVIYVCTPIY